MPFPPAPSGLAFGGETRTGRTQGESIQGHQPYHPVSFVQAEAITFTVVQPPRHGLIEHTSNGQHYHQTTTFTMDDIYQNRISYSHDGSNSLKDRFAFTVSDGTNPFFIMEDGGKKVKGQREVRETTEIADRKLPPLRGGRFRCRYSTEDKGWIFLVMRSFMLLQCCNGKICECRFALGSWS